MLPFVVLAQFAAADPSAASANRRVDDLVALATSRNAAPAVLAGYRAQVESEIAVLTRRGDGEETALSVEQTRNTVTWRGRARFSQHVTAYRARQAGPSLSALAVLRTSWLIPSLYGNDFAGLFGSAGAPASRAQEGERQGRGKVAVHPFGPAGARTYRFTGGDTIAVLRTERRAIPVVRILVEPQPLRDSESRVVFRGEIDLDADRGEIVRMRGQFVTRDRNGPQRQRLLVLPVEVLAYVDLESVEINGEYWLPRTQRIETHVNLGGIAEGRSVFRIVSRFRSHEALEAVTFRESAGMLEAPAGGGAVAHQLTFAGRDSLTRPATWWTPLGMATETVRGDDFADVSEPPQPTGSSRIAWRAQRLADVVRFNRVEGWATGGAVRYAASPRLSLDGQGTWAWTERAVRGRLELASRDSARTRRLFIRAGRTLDITNDFTAPRDSGGAFLAALAGIDDYDYVDRRSLLIASDWIAPRTGVLRVEAGVGSDRAAAARLTSGPFGSETPLRPNRGVDPGTWVRAAVTAEWNPAVNAGFVSSGVGAMVRTEAAGGELHWTRATARVNARVAAAGLLWALRIDGGFLAGGDPPPQQLFELGGGAAFPGYGYKEFAGDRALAAHLRGAWQLPVGRAPVRLLGCTCLAAPAPELAVTWHGAALAAGTPAALASMARLRPDSSGTEAAPRPTDGLKSSVELGLRFFGGAATIALVRPVDTRGRWRPAVVLGQPW